MITRRRISVRVRVALAAVAVLALLGGAWLWVRDSSLVAVRNVTISGVYGPEATQIRSALTLAARNMTTLDVRLGQLRTAVGPYPVVKDVRVSTQFPHGMRIRVIEQLPVGALTAGGRSVAVSGDGTLLQNVATGSLPQIPVRLLPGGSQITDRPTLDSLALLAVTPARMLSRIAQVTDGSAHGLVAALRSGPSIYFGDASELDAKWIAATEVLADPSSAGAIYIDVSDPSRPVAGASPEAVAAAGLASSGTSSTTGGTASTTGAAAGSSAASTVAPSTDQTATSASVSGG
ncbi:MAG TPA: FtsQ-type POTRA domain-containing protein [Solirubrobacteraceae bacterium]|nr:FtsQ-type POTRA domain-containing protein [Solirubrobacteraceae bacterium]